MKSTHTDDARWNAVDTRDRELDGTFVYAVRTTGVYCKPSCASRRALRANVRFFADPGEAEAAGFRACKRCDPRVTESATSRVIAKARTYLEAHVDAPPALGTLAKAVGMSPSHLQRTFTREVGVSPRKYAAALRADRLKTHLRAGATVSRATFDAGYGASSRAYDAATEQLGMTPGAYRRGGKGVHIRYMTAATSLGRLLVAATERGVCAVTLGDDDATLEDALHSEYPQSTRTRVRGTRGNEQLRGWVAAVSSYLEGTVREIAVPLDVAGYAVSATGMARAAEHSVRRDSILFGGRPVDRGADGRPRGRERVREKSGVARDPLSSRRAWHWSTRRLSMGTGAQGAAARARARDYGATSGVGRSTRRTGEPLTDAR
jgi:Adenosine deaminase